jgi:hypothetical protein
MSPEFQQLLRILKSLTLLIITGLFVGALFYIPDPYKEQLKGHFESAKQAYRDDAARARAMEYMSTQMSLLGVVMTDIRCVWTAAALVVARQVALTPRIASRTQARHHHPVDPHRGGHHCFLQRDGGLWCVPCLCGRSPSIPTV